MAWHGRTRVVSLSTRQPTRPASPFIVVLDGQEWPRGCSWLARTGKVKRGAAEGSRGRSGVVAVAVAVAVWQAAVGMLASAVDDLVVRLNSGWPRRKDGRAYDGFV